MPRMICLIRKDIMLIYRYMWLVLIYAFVFSGFIQSNNSTLLYGLLPGLVLILGIGSDARLPNQQFLVTLPVKRSYLVLSKYASSLIFLVSAIVICFIMNVATDMIDFGTVRIDVTFVLGTLISMILFMSLYLPLYYWLGVKGAQFLNIAMMVIIMVGNGAVTALLSSEDMAAPLEWLSSHALAAGVLLASATVLALVVSYLISVSIFRKKDL